MTVLALDIDDVCGDLVTHWLNLYNADYGDNLQRTQITDWMIHAFTKPECGERLYEYINNPHIYDGVSVIPFAVQAVNILREKARVIFVTSFNQYNSGRKFSWLNDNGFDVNIHDYIEARDKSLVSYSVLIDDAYHNFRQRSKNLLFNAPWNLKYETRRRISDWETCVNGTNSWFNGLLEKCQK